MTGCAFLDPGMIYGSFGEKSVITRNVESTFSTILPLASDLSRTLCHSGSSRKACQLEVAASRLGCARVEPRGLPLRGSPLGVQDASTRSPCLSRSFCRGVGHRA